jgi:hypothetical protein
MILKTAWENLIKKQASGVDDCDFGEVQQIQEEFIVTEKGIINKKRYCLPKNLIAGFDGHTLYFRIMKAELNRYRQDDIKLRKIAKKLIQ